MSKGKLTSRSSIKPENLGLGCQVFWSIFRLQDVSCIVQFGLKNPHLLEQAMNRIFKGCVVIDINKYGTKSQVSNNHTTPIPRHYTEARSLGLH
jgi:hypothetical protein